MQYCIERVPTNIGNIGWQSDFNYESLSLLCVVGMLKSKVSRKSKLSRLSSFVSLFIVSIIVNIG
jgi:hypothetical protein